MNKNTVLITGVDGFLGGKITKYILEKTDLKVLGLTMSQQWTDLMFRRENIEPGNRVRVLLNDEFLLSEIREWNFYGAIHLAFSRRVQPAQEIASSIVFASKVFHKLSDIGTDRVIYMSSQGIYGNTDQIP